MRPSRCRRIAWRLTTGLSLALTPPLAAQTNDDVVAAGAAFLLFPVGGRAAALGQAAVADGGSGELAFWNPAGLARLANPEVVVHRATTFVSDNTVLSGYLTSRRLGVVGLAGYLVDYGSQDITRGPGQTVGRISLKNLEVLASYATTLAGPLAVGINYKLIQFRHDCSGDCGLFPSVTGTTHGVDVGVQFASGRDRGLSLGAALQHAGFKLQLENRDQADPLPTRLQLGAAYRMPLPTREGVEPSFVRLLVDVQEGWGEFSLPDLRLGGEFQYGEAVRLRGGYAVLDAETRGPSLGAGLSVGRLTIDFARVFYASGTFDEPVYLSLHVAL